MANGSTSQQKDKMSWKPAEKNAWKRGIELPTGSR